ncbi:MAG: M20 family metallopeptidase [Candidatus Peribacteraceae bacterium]|nr:M20 family metallopeptidase [Candidatus Peribacteraceae bacterium]
MPFQPDATHTRWLVDTTKELVAIPSHMREGELQKLALIRRRLEAEGGYLTGNQALHFTSLPNDADPQVLVVEKGSEKARHRVVIDAHVDTVEHISKGDKDQDDWPGRFTLREAGDKLVGMGVYDMQTAIAILMWSLLNIDLPDDVRLTAAFPCDEEVDSKGAMAFIEYLRQQLHARVNTWVSSEVGPQHPNDNDRRQQIIIARPGVLKVHGKITVAQSSNHGALRDMPNAAAAYRHLMNFLEEEFNPRQVGESERPYHANSHPYLGDDWVSEVFADVDNRSVLTAPQKMKFGYKVFLVPPEKPDDNFSLDAALAVQKACVDEVALRRDWSTKRIGAELNKDTLRTSYPPFFTSPDHAIIKAMAEQAEIVCHPGVTARVTGGSSNADPNLFYEFLRQQQTALRLDPRDAGVIFGMPYDGANAHAKLEYASKKSAMNNCELYRRLLQEVIPRLLQGSTA